MQDGPDDRSDPLTEAVGTVFEEVIVLLWDPPAFSGPERTALLLLLGDRFGQGEEALDTAKSFVEECCEHRSSSVQVMVSHLDL